MSTISKIASRTSLFVLFILCILFPFKTGLVNGEVFIIFFISLGAYFYSNFLTKRNTKYPETIIAIAFVQMTFQLNICRSILANTTSGDLGERIGTFFQGSHLWLGLFICVLLLLVQIFLIKGVKRKAIINYKYGNAVLPGRIKGVDIKIENGTIGGEEGEEEKENLRKKTDYMMQMTSASSIVRGTLLANVYIFAITCLLNVFMNYEKIGSLKLNSLLTGIAHIMGLYLILILSGIMLVLTTGMTVSKTADKSPL